MRIRPLGALMSKRWFIGVLFTVTTMFVGHAAATVVSPLSFDELVRHAFKSDLLQQLIQISC